MPKPRPVPKQEAKRLARVAAAEKRRADREAKEADEKKKRQEQWIAFKSGSSGPEKAGAASQDSDKVATRDELGEQLYPLVVNGLKTRGKKDTQAGKVTGMFLEMTNSEISSLLESPRYLDEKLTEALEVLDKHKDASHVNAIHTRLEELSIKIAAKRNENLEGNIGDQTKTTEYSFAANSSPLRTIVAGKGASFKAVMASTLRKKAEKTRMCCTKGHEVIKLSYKNNYDRCALCKKSGVMYHCAKMYSVRWNSPCRR